MRFRRQLQAAKLRDSNRIKLPDDRSAVRLLAIVYTWLWVAGGLAVLALSAWMAIPLAWGSRRFSRRDF